MAMEDILKISYSRKRKVISTILNLYLFNQIKSPEFKDGKEIITSNYAIAFQNGSYNDSENELIFEFFQLISDKLTKKQKHALYFMLCSNATFVIMSGLEVGEEQRTDHLIRIHSKIFYSFVDNKSLHPHMNNFLHFVADFNSMFEIGSDKTISKIKYNSIIRNKIKEIQRFEIENQLYLD